MKEDPSKSKPTKLEKRLREALEKREPKRGLFIAFEGPKGSGKTTQSKLFKEWLRTSGCPVVTTKWNSSPLIKPLIKVRKKARTLGPEEFCLLHAADMRYRLDTVILPALWEGKTVVADQWFFAALARDAARGLHLDWLLNTYSPIYWPDAVFYFSISAETSSRRLFAARTPSFYESGQDVTQLGNPFDSYKVFLKRVLQEYEALSLIFQFTKLNAEESVYDQHQRIRLFFRQCKRRPWVEWNVEVVSDWLQNNPQAWE